MAEMSPDYPRDLARSAAYLVSVIDHDRETHDRLVTEFAELGTYGHHTLVVCICRLFEQHLKQHHGDEWATVVARLVEEVLDPDRRLR